MSEVILEEKQGKICDVCFAYVKLRTPTNKYESDETEYSVNVIVDKQTAKTMKKTFPKNGVKELENEEFVEKFKIDPPFPDQDEQCILNFKSDSHYNDGNEKPYHYNTRPKVYVPVDGGVKDVTMDVRVANGSKGDVAFSIVENKFGTLHRLLGILVKDLIELESNYENPFGPVVESDSNSNEEEDIPDFFDED